MVTKRQGGTQVNVASGSGSRSGASSSAHLLIAMVDGTCIDPLFTQEQEQVEKARLLLNLSIHIGLKHTKGMVSMARDDVVRQQIALISKWCQDRHGVQRMVESNTSAISDIKRTSTRSTSCVIKESKNMSAEAKEKLIVDTDAQGDALIEPFMKLVTTWPMLRRRAENYDLYADISRIIGCAHGLPRRVLMQVNKALKKPPVDPNDNGKPITIATLLDIAAYVSDDRIEANKIAEENDALATICNNEAQTRLVQSLLAAGRQLDEDNYRREKIQEEAAVAIAAQVAATTSAQHASTSSSTMLAIAPAPPPIPAHPHALTLVPRLVHPIMPAVDSLFPQALKRRRTGVTEAATQAHAMVAPTDTRETLIMKKGDHVLIPRSPNYDQVRIMDDECTVTHYRGILHTQSHTKLGFGWTIEWFPITVRGILTPASLEAVLDSNNILPVKNLRPFLVAQISPQAYHMELIALDARNKDLLEKNP